MKRPAPQVDPHVAAGYAAYQAGDLAAAREAYRRALGDDPSNRDALLGMAAVEMRAGATTPRTRSTAGCCKRTRATRTRRPGCSRCAAT